MSTNKASEIFSNIIVNQSNNWFAYLTLLLPIIYWLYYRKYRNYIFQQKNEIKTSKQPRGKCPPFAPNGWYSLMNSDELKINEVKYVDYCGRDIVLFRGTNGKVYALSAYCSHMGANLGIGGVVKHDQCIQCPFHGWTFDGETGNSVLTERLNKKHVSHYKYHDLDRMIQEDNCYLKKVEEGDSKLKKYIVVEKNNSILIWFDSRDEFFDKPQFEPIVLEHKLDYRGESINYVNCHIQEIPENGADMRHFDFLHTTVMDHVSFLRFEWHMKSHRASDPDLIDAQKHKYEFINEFKTKLFKRYLNDDNKHFINVISLDCYIHVFKLRFFAFNVTGFQLGPALVYLFLKSYIFETVLAQSVTPLKKFYLKVSHKIFTSNYLPYCVTAYMLYGEVSYFLLFLKFPITFYHIT
jgi:cholesterol 7-desaturase